MKVLVAEISGKRPGGKDKRPTEKFNTKYDHVIISNNSENYVTDWPIVMVPDDYLNWYKENVRQSEKMWYAQMNRSYAIKYAKENGYDYLVQLDDNIIKLEIAYKFDYRSIVKKYQYAYSHKDDGILDDFIDCEIAVLENTNAVMCGLRLAGVSVPDSVILKERYCYSFFALKLNSCPEVFHGDFEDDIEYRLKCAQMNLPVIQISFMKYSKISQKKTGDKTGCRGEYDRVGIKRGENMTKLYSDVYKASMTTSGSPITQERKTKKFRHDLKAFEIGACIYDYEKIKNQFRSVLKKRAKEAKRRIIIKEKRLKNG